MDGGSCLILVGDTGSFFTFLFVVSVSLSLSSLSSLSAFSESCARKPSITDWSLAFTAFGSKGSFGAESSCFPIPATCKRRRSS